MTKRPHSQVQVRRKRLTRGKRVRCSRGGGGRRRGVERRTTQGREDWKGKDMRMKEKGSQDRRETRERQGWEVRGVEA